MTPNCTEWLKKKIVKYLKWFSADEHNEIKSQTLFSGNKCTVMPIEAKTIVVTFSV